MLRRSRPFAAAACVALGTFWNAASRADEIRFKNGDRLTGTIVVLDKGELKFKSKVAGEVTISVADVQTIATDAPVTIVLPDGSSVQQRLVAAGDGRTALAEPAPGRPAEVELATLRQINPSKAWSGAVVVGGLITRGNSDTESLSVTIDALRRTERDRLTLGAAYLFGRETSPDTGDKSTSTDNWFAAGKYDYFFEPKFYGFGGLRVERDRIAELDLRVTPSAGVGYQWVERPDFNFSTEAGLAWVYEEYRNTEADDHFAAKLAYHVDGRLSEQVTAFHNVIYYPSVEELDDYNIVADVGVRAAFSEQMFGEFKLEFKYDATPAPDTSRDDLRYILGVGWKF